jgi:acetoacetate decarboxylase
VSRQEVEQVELPTTIPALPFRMRDVEILTVCYRTVRGASNRFVPSPLRPLGDRVLLHFYAIHDAGPYGSYNELAVHIPVEHPASGTRGGFSPMIFLGSDAAIATGRELYGQPKKFGAISLEMVGDLVVARATRNGIDFVTATTPARQKVSSAAALGQVMFGTNLNLKVIPSVDGSGDVVRELTARDFAEVEIHEVWEGFGTVELRPNAQAPVHLLPVLDVESAFHWRADFTATHGRVLERLTVAAAADPALAGG